MSRFAARMEALSVLYEADERDESIESALQERLKLQEEGVVEDLRILPEYSREIVRGVAAHKEEIDRIIRANSTWKLERMGVVDRNILRIGIWECLYGQPGSVGAYINESVKLAKIYCDGKSVNFIYGVLCAASGRNKGEKGEGPKSIELKV
ncbi:MAG: transcription antitermination factor NusB [Aeriscardovia sp.]|nr:transcription antitermination factor NusB [Aeriscardovia sp.]